MNYNSLKATINANIKQNGNQEITGVVLNSVLNAMVNALASAGATFGGVIDPTSSAPVSLDQATIYLALTPGEYTNFVDEDSEPIVVDGIALIQYDGGGTLEFSKIELKPWQMTIVPDVGSNYIGIFVPNGGCNLAVDSVGFHGMICIDNGYGISSATFEGSGGIDTSVNVQSGRTSNIPVVVLKSNNDVPITITCVAGNTPDSAFGTDEIIITPIATKAWTELGAGGGSDVFWATYGTTTAAEIATAIAANKIVMCVYGQSIYELQLNNPDYYAFYSLIDSSNRLLYCYTSNSVWTNSSIALERTSNKKTDIASNRTNETYYPNTKGVFDLTSKWGVISQTQTWTQQSDNSYTYAMSDLVYGAIPQANIDLFESAGATFNATSGYFQLNGLTDISYEEMQVIYRETLVFRQGVVSPSGASLAGINDLRTNLPVRGYSFYMYSAASTFGYLFWRDYYIEVVAFNSSPSVSASNYSNCFNLCNCLKKILGIIEMSGISSAGNVGNMFNGCYSLEEVSLKGLKVNLSFAASPNLSLASVVYMVENAVNTSAITITLHATAYARCQADTTEYSYGGNTYTGILALATAHNITIASA